MEKTWTYDDHTRRLSLYGHWGRMTTAHYTETFLRHLCDCAELYLAADFTCRDISDLANKITAPRLIVSPSNQHYREENNMLLSKDGTTLHFCIDREGKAIVPESVHSYDSLAFHNAPSVTEIHLPDNIKTVYAHYFTSLRPLTISIPHDCQVIKIIIIPFVRYDNLTFIKR